MADRNWNFTKIHIEEMIILANAGRRKSKGGPVVEVPLSGAAIAVYINLRGRIYATKKGERRFYAYPSQDGIAKDLGWNPKKPKNRVSEAIRDLRDAGIIRVFNKEDTSEEARNIRKMIGCGWSTSVYELLLLRVALEKIKSEVSDSNRTGVPLESDPVPTTIGGHSDYNRSKEEEHNNKKKEDSIIIINENNPSMDGIPSHLGGSVQVYNVRTGRYEDTSEVRKKILECDWDFEFLFQDYHWDDVDDVIATMKPSLKIVQDIRKRVVRLKVGLDD